MIGPLDLSEGLIFGLVVVLVAAAFTTVTMRHPETPALEDLEATQQAREHNIKFGLAVAFCGVVVLAMSLFTALALYGAYRWILG